MDKLDKYTDGASLNIIQDNIEKLKTLFPDILSEGKIDFEALRALLGDAVVAGDERYNFTWHGKAAARRIAQTPSTGTLRPCKEESKNWDSTQNLFIEGDNLEVLKLLQKSYHKQVKMIYIDPPYNTGKEFIYPDNYKDNLDTYLEYTGQKDAEGRKFGTNAETSGRYHTNWLNMMYPRLKLARNLLRDDGVIFISIDDNEQASLRKLCDEIFGEENFVACLVWEKGRKNDAKLFSIGHDYMLIFAKSRASLTKDNVRWRESKPGAFEIQQEYLRLKTLHGDATDLIQRDLRDFYSNLPKTHPSKKLTRYSNVDGRGVWRDDNMSWPGGGGPTYEVLHSVTNQPCKVPEGGWRYSTKEKMQEMIESGRVQFRADHTEPPIRKTYLVRGEGEENIDFEEAQEDDVGIQVAGTYFYRSALQASNLMLELFKSKIFDSPKDHEVLSRWINYVCVPSKDALVLDFFSGSCTTAHAVMNLNALDNGNRKFIMVQLPEPCDEKSEAYNAGYLTIADIGKERIRRAGEKILQEYNKTTENSLLDPPSSQPSPSREKESFPCNSVPSVVNKLDIGFKVFKLDSSNIKPWDADFDNLESALFDTVDNIKAERSEDDVLYEILLKYGLDLTVPIEERFIETTENTENAELNSEKIPCNSVPSVVKKKIYIIGLGALVICLDDAITLDVVEGIGELKGELAPEVMRVVFKDSGFADDVVKTNAIQILKKHGIDDVKSL